MYSLGNKTIVWVVRKVRTDILLAELIYFEVQCLPRSAHFKIFLIFVILMASFKSAYTFLTKLFFFYISVFLSVFFFASFFFYYYLSIFLHLTKTIFCRKRLCFIFLVFRCIGEYISLDLFCQFCQPHQQLFTHSPEKECFLSYS